MGGGNAAAEVLTVPSPHVPSDSHSKAWLLRGARVGDHLMEKDQGKGHNWHLLQRILTVPRNSVTDKRCVEQEFTEAFL